MLGPSGLPVASLNLWPADASQKTEQTMKTALLGKKKIHIFFPNCVAVQNIILCRGSCIPLYKSDGSCCSFSLWKYLYFTNIVCYFRNQFWWKEEKSRWTWKRSRYLFSIKKKVRHENLYSKLFLYILKLYLLICIKLSFIWGSGLGPAHHPLCSNAACLLRHSLP